MTPQPGPPPASTRGAVLSIGQAFAPLSLLLISGKRVSINARVLCERLGPKARSMSTIAEDLRKMLDNLAELVDRAQHLQVKIIEQLTRWMVTEKILESYQRAAELAPEQECLQAMVAENQRQTAQALEALQVASQQLQTLLNQTSALGTRHACYISVLARIECTRSNSAEMLGVAQDIHQLSLSLAEHERSASEQIRQALFYLSRIRSQG